MVVRLSSRDPAVGLASGRRPASGRTIRTRWGNNRWRLCKSPGTAWRLSCQTYRMTERGGDDLAGAVSNELANCRKRGIERVDLRSHNQKPLQIPELDRLAAEYVRSGPHYTQGRAVRLKVLLRDALGAFAELDPTDAALVRAVFFGDSLDRVTKSAGELLDIARRQYGATNEVRFRQVRHQALDSFADFLPRFVAEHKVSADAGLIGAVANDVLPQPELVPTLEEQRQVATTGYIDNGEHFINLLSQAENVTIVGFTNEQLAPMLRAALERKRDAMLRPDVCWDSIRVVFLNDELLNQINDERGYPNPYEALLLRRRASVHGRRTVKVFFRSLPTERWAIYDSPYFPPFIGTLFEMPNGQRIVQLLIRRPQRRPTEHLYLEIEDTRGHYFSATFDEIVHSSIDDTKVVPVGIVIDERFRVTGARYRHNVLIDGSHETGWLAMVLVITWRMRNGRAEPLLQLRTQLNAARELDRLTHLAGHIVQSDPNVPLPAFGLHDEVPMAAARRRVQMETGDVDPGQLEPLGTCAYFHHDKEHLFFFIYGCQLPEGFRPWRQAEMSPMSVPELLAIRKNQALRKALALCRSPAMSRTVRRHAFEIAALNLELHDLPDIAAKLTHAADRLAAEADDLAAEIGSLEERTRQTWVGFDGDVEVHGISGLQYREFYSILLPFYARAGVPGAAEHIALISAAETKRAAAQRLSELYHNERLMELIPVEL